MQGGKEARRQGRRKGNEKRASLLGQKRSTGGDDEIFCYRRGSTRMSIIHAADDSDVSTTAVIPEDFDFDLIVRSVLSDYFLVSGAVDGLGEETVGTSLEICEFIFE